MTDYDHKHRMNKKWIYCK